MRQERIDRVADQILRRFVASETDESTLRKQFVFGQNVSVFFGGNQQTQQIVTHRSEAAFGDQTAEEVFKVDEALFRFFHQGQVGFLRTHVGGNISDPLRKEW